MANCQYADGSNVCITCGRPITATHVKRNCRPGLGDRLAAGLAAVGITKERVAAVVGDCGCKERQDWLNMIGHRIGIGAPPGPEQPKSPDFHDQQTREQSGA